MSNDFFSRRPRSPRRYPAPGRHASRLGLPAVALALVLLLLFTPARAAAQTLDQSIRELLTGAELRQTRFSLLVTDLDRDRDLIRLDPDEPMIPASNMKLVTSLAALHQLGPDFSFETELRLIAEGPTRDPSGESVTLHIVGSGDPALGDPVVLRDETPKLRVEHLLAAWVQAVQRAGVTRVGRVLLDDRVFDRQFVHPDWPEDQLGKHYFAEVAGLNFHRNAIGVLVNPTRSGLSPRVTLSPDAPAGFIAVRNRARTAPGSRAAARIYRSPSNQIYVSGSVGVTPRDPFPVSVHDPPRFLGAMFADRLRRAGIEVGRIEMVGADDRLDEGRLLHRVRTPLATVLHRCNKDSENLYAEALLKRCGYARTGTPGSWSTGAAAVRAFLSDRLRNSQAAVVRVRDGSGLSRDNRVTARALVALVEDALDTPDRRELFLESLAVGGEDGTLQRRFDRPLHGAIHAKTGYLRGVYSLSGVLLYDLPDRDRPYAVAFSFLFNEVPASVSGSTIKTLQESILQRVDDHFAEALGLDAVAANP